MLFKTASLITLCAICISACSAETQKALDASASSQDEGSNLSTSASSSASANAIKGVEGGAVSIANDNFEFKYSWPAAAARQSALVRYLTQDREKSLAELETETTDAQKEAKENDYPYNAYSSSMKWEKVTELPGFLSLSGEWYTYTGGAHGMSGVNSLIWDKTNEKPLDGTELFTDKSDLDQAVQSEFCDKLDKERSKRRGAPVMRSDDNGFSECIKPSEQTVLVGSSNGTTFDRLTIYAGPYSAGPYVEGAYEINLAVTSAVLAAVKPAYKKNFSATK